MIFTFCLSKTAMPLPLIPHCDLDPNCCGCLILVVENEGSKFVCNECGAVLSQEQVATLVFAMESTEATCPHCRRVNEINGFSEICAFRCRHCGKGVGLLAD
jgi:hypothetical protein